VGRPGGRIRQMSTCTTIVKTRAARRRGRTGCAAQADGHGATIASCWPQRLFRGPPRRTREDNSSAAIDRCLLGSVNDARSDGPPCSSPAAGLLNAVPVLGHRESHFDPTRAQGEVWQTGRAYPGCLAPQGGTGGWSSPDFPVSPGTLTHWRWVVARARTRTGMKPGAAGRNGGA